MIHLLKEEFIFWLDTQKKQKADFVSRVENLK